MTMKKIWILLLLFPLAGCNDWLDIESENAVTLTGYFKDEHEVERWMYSVFSAEVEIMTKSPGLMEYSGLLCDEAGAYESYRRLDPVFCMDKQHRLSWKSHYNLIYLADVLIENRHRFKNIPDYRADFWIAQAYFAKAFAYFDLARRWGEAPIPKGSESMDAEGKKTVDEVLAEALRCANEALILPKHEDLKDSYSATVTSKQFASIGSVHTLLANIYAWMGGLYGKEEYWRKAEAEASLVIGGDCGVYDLEGSIDLMLKNCQGSVRNSKETIFCLELNKQDQDYTSMTDFAVNYPGMLLINYPYLAMNPRDIETDADLPKIKTAKVKEIYPEEADVRRNRYWYKLEKVKYPNPQVSGDSIVSEYAFLDKWNEAVYQTNTSLGDSYSGVILMEGNRIIWRLADLILLRAECRARLNSPASDILGDLDRVRERAGLRKYNGSKDPEMLRKEIFRERERELFGEGVRYFDVVRNGYFREELQGNYTTLTDEDVANGALYLPVHQSSFLKNVYMKQNTYWQWQQ